MSRLNRYPQSNGQQLNEEVADTRETENQFEIVRNIKVKPEADDASTIQYEPLMLCSEDQLKEEKDEDRKFLHSFLPLMNQMSWTDKSKFKRKIELIIDKVLKS